MPNPLLQKEVEADEVSNKTLKHGQTKMKLKRCWEQMVSRCTNPNNPQYHNYGGRGIKVCDRWLESFENFKEDMEATHGAYLTLDRIDVNGHYEPSNCRWITMQEQQKNRRDCVYYTHEGRTMIQADWARELGIKPHTLRWRVGRYGVEKALTMPTRTNNYKYRMHNEKAKEEVSHFIRAKELHITVPISIEEVHLWQDGKIYKFSFPNTTQP